jgi:RNA methyltransferase, TrmH family
MDRRCESEDGRCDGRGATVWDPVTMNASSMRAITSRQNPVVARFRALAESADPTGARLLLDGVHLVRDAHESGHAFEIAAISASQLASDGEEAQLARALRHAGVDVIEASDSVFAAMSPVRTPSGLVAIASRRPTSASDVCGLRDAFVLVAIDVQDPGNLGALIRTAEASGMTGMFASGASANPFSWKAVRGSMGSALRLPVVGGMTNALVMTCLRSAGIRTVAAVPRGGEDPDAIDWRGRVALILGGEGAGVPDEVTRQSDLLVSIPMTARVESLNVAAAGAILVYAARRQRGL